MLRNQCIAHRGYSSAAPENTLAAFQKAVACSHVGMIELDVQMSKDGVPVIIHDYILDRTTNGKGYVGETTLHELKQLDAGSWFDPTFKGERLPTLEEVLQMLKGKVKLNLEIKRAGDWYPGIEGKIVELLRRNEMAAETVITSFNHDTIRNISRMAPDVKTGLLIEGQPVLIQELLAFTGATCLSMCYPYLTSALVKPLLQAGVYLIAWTVDDPQEMRKLIKLDPRIAICTNFPDRFCEIR
jgi:glycerophosphoryl diester phosphodiesterase